jgi:hypothetical protein
MAKDPTTAAQKAAREKKKKKIKIASAMISPTGAGIGIGGAKLGSIIASKIKGRRQAKAGKAFDELSFGEAFKQKRKELGKDSTFTWRGKKYTTVTKDDLKKKAPKKETFKQKRIQRIKKRINKNLSKPGKTKKLGRQLKRLRRVSERKANKNKTSTNKTPVRVKISLADGGSVKEVATVTAKPSQIGTRIKKPVKVKSKKAVKTRRPKKKLRGGIGRPIVDRLPIMPKLPSGKLPSPPRDLGLRNRPEKRLVRAMKKGAGKKLEEAVKRTSVPKNKKNMDLPPSRREGISIKGYKRGDLVQGYDDRLHESLGARHPGKKTQSLKSRSDESKGAEKAAGKRAYASVKTMDKGTRKAKPRGVGVAKRGYGKALS